LSNDRDTPEGSKYEENEEINSIKQQIKRLEEEIAREESKDPVEWRYVSAWLQLPRDAFRIP
jgi:hypothetical protein